jgi:hypothetical protein
MAPLICHHFCRRRWQNDQIAYPSLRNPAAYQRQLARLFCGAKATPSIRRTKQLV